MSDQRTGTTWRRRSITGLALGLLVISSCLAGCSWAGRDSRLARPLAKGSPVVLIHPLDADYRTASVGVPPFLVPAGMDPAKGAGVAETFREVLLGKRTFRQVSRLAEPVAGIAEARALAAGQGLDLVLVGRISSCVTGSALGGSQLELAVRLVSVGSGETVWLLSEAMAQPLPFQDDGYPARLKEAVFGPDRSPVDAYPAMPNLALTIASDMADVLAGARSLPR
ncbi:MAG: hypothetical protein AB1634_13165 [Thermodesulfobacteriota bacterium]